MSADSEPTPSFQEFYCAIHPGRQPFPWQSRLAEKVVASGWPTRLDLPTASGKTSAIDIALWALAIAPERMPRRIMLVVDRRIIVDQGAAHAQGICDRMHAATDGPAKVIADKLRKLCGEKETSEPFDLAVMRGGKPQDNDWAKRPDRPLVGVSTVDQVGYSLFFKRGGDKTPSIFAGMVGNDTLILLDEVHLSVPFAQTLDSVKQNFRTPCSELPDRFVVVRMSATADDAPGERFELDEADMNNPTLGRRMSASKTAKLVEIEGKPSDDPHLKIAEVAVDEALKMQGAFASENSVIAVVVNRVASATRACALIREHSDKTDVILVTGSMRAMDRDKMVREQLYPRCGNRGERQNPRPLIVVATQCIEAGADLDFDGLVTECASLDSLKQRFGRLDRQGMLGRTNAVIVLHTHALKKDEVDFIYGGALAQTWKWMKENLNEDGLIDFGINSLANLTDGVPGGQQSLSAPRKNAPVLMPKYLDLWSQTSPRPQHAPEISLWLHGEEEKADVEVIWRSDLVLPNSKEDEQRMLERSMGILTSFRTSPLEAMTLSCSKVREWLKEDEPVASRKGKKTTQERGGKIIGLRWDFDGGSWVTAEDIGPGDVIIVPCEAGGISNLNFDPRSTELVTDIGAAADLRGRGRVSLRLTPSALACLGVDVEIGVDQEGDIREALRAEAKRWIFDADAAVITRSEWGVLQASILGSKAGVVIDDENVCGFILPISKSIMRRQTAEILVNGSSSFTGEKITLTKHGLDVKTIAGRFARSLMLPSALVDDLMLAGWYHDVGKAYGRFQALLSGGDLTRGELCTEPLAKTSEYTTEKSRAAAWRASGLPGGFRHEILSLDMISNSSRVKRANDPELVMHLISSHHGRCRPFAPSILCENEDDVHFVVEGEELVGNPSRDFSALDSGVSERFWALTARYGWWGLAWLEAILRLADHRASEWGGETE